MSDSLVRKIVVVNPTTDERETRYLATSAKNVDNLDSFIGLGVDGNVGPITKLTGQDAFNALFTDTETQSWVLPYGFKGVAYKIGNSLVGAYIEQIDFSLRLNSTSVYKIFYAKGLADEKFTNYEQFEKDIERMSELFDKKAKSIHILGGEPLLNKDVIKYLQKTREAFPDVDLTEIRLISNGILVNSMKQEFWEALRKYSIILSVTKYPLKLDYELMKETADKYNAMFEFYDNTDKELLPKMRHH